VCCNERLINTDMVISKLDIYRTKTADQNLWCTVYRDREPQG